MKTFIRNFFLPVFFCLFRVCSLQAQGPAPPNTPATGSLQNRQLVIVYDHRNMLTASIDIPGVRFTQIDNEDKGRVDEAFLLESMNGAAFTINGTIYGTDEAFACEADYPRKAIPIVRHSVGPSHSLLNRAVYDRQRDWVLSFDQPCPVVITPLGEESGMYRFQFSSKTSKLIIRFRPRFYQQHKGLSYFEPWNYKVWNKPVVGWCSWFAYLNTVTEENIHTVADSLSKTLLPYGYEYLQIDDGYQQEPTGRPEHWLQPNKKFPAGLSALAGYISSKGLKPGIWTNVSCADSAWAFENPALYVKDQSNHPAMGDWIGYIMDGSEPQTTRQLIQPVYSSLRKMGWDYFKVDALRHLKYEGYNTYQRYFNEKKTDRDEAFRNIVKSVRAAIGNDSYLLGCWGIRPELAGLIDGCRIGNDGFSYAGLAQYNSFNNVVWRNDPDHVELTDAEAYRSCSVTSLTGSVLLLTDKPERYKGAILEAARRAAPVLFTKPGQVYEVDPSRIRSLQQASTEVSGDGPRVFDAGYTAYTELYALEINRPFEDWLLLGRMNDRTPKISLTELGLKKDTDYEVFEFWTKQLIGTVKSDLIFPVIDSRYNCQVFCFREKQNHPQLLATSRHLSCGGLELKDCDWKNGRLSGESELVANDDYTIYIYVPDGYVDGKFVSGAQLVSREKKQNMLVICIKKDSAGPVKWSLDFSN